MLRPASPRFLWNDLRAFWRGRTRHQYFAATLAVLIPIAIVVGFYFDSRTNLRPPAQVIYVESWPANRTDAEIRAKQKADLARQRAHERERQRQFQRFNERLGPFGN